MNIQYIYIGSDHGGFALKETLAPWLVQFAPVQDLGAEELNEDDDYPVFAQRVAQAVMSATETPTTDPQHLGVLVCRTGVGMSMVANRFPHVRAAVCRNQEDARLARAHNNANVLILEGDRVELNEAKAIAQVFLSTQFEGGRHARRLDQMAALDSKQV